jgi:hypothetical protein
VDWCSTSPKADAALRFLDVPVPEVPFPRANSTGQFWHLERGEPTEPAGACSGADRRQARAVEAAMEPSAWIDNGGRSAEGPELAIRLHSGEGRLFLEVRSPNRRRAFAFGSGRLTSDSRYLNTLRPCSTPLYCRTNSNVRRHPNMSSYTTTP